MLHLERKIGESIVLAKGSIKITVTAIQKPNSAKLSIEAPQDVDIWREELFLEHQENEGSDYC